MKRSDSWQEPVAGIRIVLATASPDLQQRLSQATEGNFRALPLGPLPASPAALFAHLKTAPRPDVILLDSGPDPQPALELAARFDAQCPGISVIIVSDRGAEIGLDAMRVGVRDILSPLAEVDAIRSVLDRAYEVSQIRTSEPETVDGGAHLPTGRVITVVSAKGGVGKTTVATNLAVGLARTGRNSTVLVDLDIQFGDVASALNLEPEYCLPDAVRGQASRDPMVLKAFLSLHETGLYVICGPRTPAEADAVTAHDVGHLLHMLVSEFQYVVVDTAPGLSEHVLAAMDQTTELVLVTSMDVPGVRGLRKELDALTQLGMLSDSRHVVLNFAAERGGLSVSDVEATIGSRVDFLLPRSKAALESVNQGIPLLQNKKSRDQMTRQLDRLLARFTTPAAPVRSIKASRKETRRAPGSTGRHPKRAAPRWYRVRKAAA
jgi:pilus assembly protein CpaE